MADKPRVSIVIPAFNEAPCLEKLHQELTAACDMLPFHFEFLFVNDGSTDETEEVLAELRSRDDRVRYLALSRNFGHQGALSAGLAFAAGDAVIMMDADLQHPPGMIPRLLECWEDGYEVVNTVRLDTEDSSLRQEALVAGLLLGFQDADRRSDRARQRRLPADVARARRRPQQAARASPLHPRAGSVAGLSADQRDVPCARAVGGPSQIHIPPQPAAGPGRRDGIQLVSVAAGRGLRLVRHGRQFHLWALYLVLAAVRADIRSGAGPR